MSIHIHIHFAKKRKKTALSAAYNTAGRHPLQGVSAAHPHAGNARIGAPLALVAVIGGILSYALVDRPYSGLEDRASSVAMAQIEPAAGSVPQPETIQNEMQGESSGRSVPLGPALSVRDLPESEYAQYVDFRAEPLTPQQMDARLSPAKRFVSVTKNISATGYESLLASARRALEMGHYESAAGMFEKLRVRRAKDKRALMGLAVALQKSGQKDQAIEIYEALLKQDPRHTDAIVNMSGLLQEERPDDAFNRLSKLSQSVPDNAGVAAQLGMVSAQMGREDEALRYMGVAAALEPENAGHIYNMAVMIDRRGAHRKALSLYEKALEMDATYGAGRSVPRETIYDRLYYLRRL